MRLQRRAWIAAAAVALYPAALWAAPATTIGLDCPPETKQSVRMLKRARADTSVLLPHAAKEVYCARKSGLAQGPALQLRRAYRFANRRLLRNRAFPRSDVVHMGSYRDGRRHGEWTQLSKRGKRLGANQMNLGAGTWNVWHESGKAGAHGRFQAGHRVGPWRFWHRTGNKGAEGRYHGGKRHEMWRFWRRNGSLERQLTYKEGAEHGLETRWHATGEKRSEGRYVDGQMHGEWLQWSANGHLLGANWLNHGDGHWIDWHDNGRKRREGERVRLKPDGLWTRWHDNGRRAAQGEFLRGIMQRDTWRYWNEAGKASKKSARSHLLGRVGSLPGMVGALRGLRRKGGLSVRGGRVSNRAVGGMGRSRSIKVTRHGSKGPKGVRTVTNSTVFPRPGGGTPVRLHVVYHSPLAAELTGARLPTVRTALVRCAEKALTRLAQGRAAARAPVAYSARFHVQIDRKRPARAVVIRKAAGLAGTRWHACSLAALAQMRPRLTGPGSSARVQARVFVR